MNKIQRKETKNENLISVTDLSMSIIVLFIVYYKHYIQLENILVFQIKWQSPSTELSIIHVTKHISASHLTRDLPTKYTTLKQHCFDVSSPLCIFWVSNSTINTLAWCKIKRPTDWTHYVVMQVIYRYITHTGNQHHSICTIINIHSHFSTKGH